MSAMEQVQSITLEAGADLSAGQFRFVLMAADGQVDLVSAAGGDADGVLLNDPDAAGKAATVAYAGRVKVVIGVGGLVAGNKVQSDASGEAILAASADHVLGKCLVGGAAGELGEVLLSAQGVLA
jgi:hypothetical protein